MSALLRSDTDFKEGKDKIPLAAIIFSLFFAVIIFRLMQLQLIRGKEYRQFSEKNRLSLEKIHALRGELLDRKGRLLAGNRPSFDLTVTRGYFGSQTEVINQFLKHDIQFSDEQMNALEKKLRITPKFDPVVLMEDISWDIIAKTRAKNYMLPGVEIVYRPMRLYPHKDLGCHALGYLREVSKNRLSELEQLGESEVTLGDFIGVWGIEKLMDKDLRGGNGVRPVIEDAFGRSLGEATADLLPSMQKREAMPGKNLFLTIDLELQRVAEESFGDRAGAAIAIDPKSGEILTMVTRPCFDLTKFSRNIPADYWAILSNDPKKPLYDRATQGIYPPGSTFKVITAAAALRTHEKDKQLMRWNRYQACQGNLRIGRETKRCWKQYPGHGFLNLPDAIAQSCDVFFYQVGLDMGVDLIADEAKRFGLGQTSGIDINQEKRGNVPSTQWKEAVYNTPWMDGETASVAIGQGFLAVTPLQMARVAGAIANHGQLVKPRLVLKAQDPATGIVSELTSEITSNIEVSEEHLTQIIQGMDRAVNTPQGTAYWSGRSQKIRIAGKTGTAQVVQQRKAGLKMLGHREDHAWFIAFAPVEDPKIAVAILVEHGGHGGTAAAPIARKIIETYLLPPL